MIGAGAAKMRILMVMQGIPYPPHTGASVRIYNLLKRVSEHCEVTLACLSDSVSLENAESLRPYCKRIEVVPICLNRSLPEKLWLLCHAQEWPRFFKRVLMILQGTPLGVASLYHISFSRKLRELINCGQYDIVQFEFVEMSIYLKDVVSLRKNVRTVLVEHDISYVQKMRRFEHSHWPKRFFFAMDYLLRRMYEKKILKRFDHVITMSEIDKKKLNLLGIPSERMTEIRNGTDIVSQSYNEIVSSKQKIVFLGTMNFFANKDGLIWFLKEIFPTIKEKVSNAKLVVIGQKDARLCEEYRSNDISFIGVIDDLSLELGNGTVFVAPIRMGSGTRLKIVTAMAFGMPVVSTSVGIEGIEANENHGAFVADTPEAFSDAVVNLLNNPSLSYRLGREAQSFVEREYSWEPIAKKLLDLYDHLP